MVDKHNILNAWMMVEQLSEGDIKIKNNNLIRLNEFMNDDCHKHFSNLIDEGLRNKKVCKGKGGLVLYLEIFNFNDVINILREKYKLAENYEEIHIGQKFTFALYFDDKLTLIIDKTFCTVSGYIRNYKEVPDEQTFHKYEEDLKADLNFHFDESEKNPQKFNDAIKWIINNFNISTENSRVQLLRNIDFDSANLHSFFINDLEKAKNIEYDMLNAYLYGFEGERIDLDSKSDSAKFNPNTFVNILQPKNYPLGRFPSNTAYSLSFMQQVAVNISTGIDSRNIRSVNGPPGTGKTTLLKDIFAQLIVTQTSHILELKERTLKGTSQTIYENNSSIGELPEKIAENGIVVTSSNNGAVQNIVNELPLISGIDDNLLSELKDADYFWRLSNEKLENNWDNESEKYVLSAEPMEEERFWGLFSLEGGKSDNMKNIITTLKHISKFLNEEYVPDKNVYKAFKEQYDIVFKMRADMQRTAKNYYDYKMKRSSLRKLPTDLKNEKQNQEKNASEKINDLHIKSSKYEEEIKNIDQQLEVLSNRLIQIKDTKNQLNICLDTLKPQKRGFFATLFGKKTDAETQKNLNEINQQILDILPEETNCLNEKNALQERRTELKKKSEECQKNIQDIEKELNNWITSAEQKTANLNKEISDFESAMADRKLNPLNLRLDYEELQLSNPWFDENYRIEQSKLFIAALKLRKQFLYENLNNLDAAIKIWDKQNKYLENKQLISIAWNWINFAIPVISSTFASFSRMCRNLDVGSLGHLFVDEAGQATPQSAIGAVLRSKYVMVVGDPSQIKPVLTLDSSILSMLSKHFGVTDKYLSDSSSVQTLVDAASKYGFYRMQEKTEDSWIGIPLWVHRRCMYPMFTISNEISYQNMMVQGKKDYGKTGWYDVGGKAIDKFVEEQAKFLKNKIQSMINENPAIVDPEQKDTIYVISPFANVAYKLSEILKDINFTRYKNNKPTNIGTIHTFQGKEAPIVFMVLGADSQSKGAASWAVSEPNMMNVAATRAKKEFYIIGDKKLYRELNSDVANSTIAIIENYCKEHPELVDNNTENEQSGNADRELNNETEKNTIAIIGNHSNEQPELIDNNTGNEHSSKYEHRISGKITYVGQGKNTKYAYVTGNDNKKYTINEKIYAETKNADTIINKNAMISFVPAMYNEKWFATNIE
ncbi:MAG: DNA helicase [Ruminococcus sp.]|nr:DNA helicase [Ruminococcus sp.]